MSIVKRMTFTLRLIRDFVVGLLRSATMTGLDREKFLEAERKRERRQAKRAEQIRKQRGST